MNNDYKYEEKIFDLSCRNQNINHLKDPISYPYNENYRILLNYPESYINEHKSLRRNNPENIFELMIIIEEINKKVF